MGQYKNMYVYPQSPVGWFLSSQNYYPHFPPHDGEGWRGHGVKSGGIRFVITETPKQDYVYIYIYIYIKKHQQYFTTKYILGRPETDRLGGGRKNSIYEMI